MTPGPADDVWSLLTGQAWLGEGFARPWVLWLLPLAGVLVVLTRARAGGVMISTAEWAGDVASSARARVLWLPGALRSIALVVLLVAAAGPREPEHDERISTEAVALQLVVDRSGSMEEPAELDGREMTRLDAVKRIVSEFVAGNGRDLQGRPDDLIGLMVFGTYADTIAPLSREHAAMLDRLESVEIPRSQSERGTAIGDALALAAARLQATEAGLRRAEGDAFVLDSKAIVLLTDGENTAGERLPIEAAEVAAAWDVRVYIVGIRGGVSRSFGGLRIPAGQSINERELSRAAEITGGRFWAVDRLDALREVYAEIDRLERTEIEIGSSTTYRELFAPWVVLGFLLVALETVLQSTVLRRLP
ncbi:MAG: VWA domain-containing protein [Planctomycetota bacterium]